MPTLMPGLRFAVLRALEQARQHVAHGYPSLQSAFHYQRLSERAWAEVDKALDDVRFTVPAEQLEATARSHGAETAEGRQLLEDCQAATGNARLPWEGERTEPPTKECPEPPRLTREQTVALLFIAHEFVQRLPAVSAGPLLPSLSLYETQE